MYWDGLQSMDTVHNKSNCYKYDNQNRISEIIDYCYDRFTTHLLTYNSAGDLISKGYEISPSYPSYPYYDRIWTFSKNETEIVVETYKNEQIELDNQELPIRRIDNAGLGAYRENTYEYYDNNLSKITFDYVNIVHGRDYVTSVVFTYDDKKSPLYNCNTPKWFLMLFFRLNEGSYNSSDIPDLMQNNRLTETLTYEKGSS